MTIYYNPDSRGFYQPDIHKTIPAGSVIITAEQKQMLRAAERGGDREIKYNQVTQQPEAVDKLRSLKDIKDQKKIEARQEALRRIQQIADSVTNLGSIAVLSTLWASITPSARQATPLLLSVFAVYDAMTAAITAIDELNAPQDVASYTIQWPK